MMLLVCYWSESFFFFKQKTAYEMRISDWSSDVCSSDLRLVGRVVAMEAVRQPVVCAVVKNRNRWKCCIRPHRFRVLGDDLLIDEGSGLCTAVDADSRKFELLHSEAPRRAATATTIAARWEPVEA